MNQWLSKTLILSFVAVVSVSGCGKKEESPLQVTIPGTEFVLIDAKASSCKGSLQSPQVEDVSGLYMELGKFNFTWTPPPEGGYRLKIIYVRIYPRSSGLSSSDPIMFAGQDLNCMFSGNIDQAPEYDETQTTIPLDYPVILGNLTPTDATKRSRFAGRGEVLVYALLRKTGEADRPITARASFNFQFDGIF